MKLIPAIFLWAMSGCTLPLIDQHLPTKNIASQFLTWARLISCSIMKAKANGCMAYSGCANGVKTWYCEGDKLHAQWPAINDTLLDFLISVGR